MEKLDPKTDGATPDIVEQNIEKLKTLFPDVFTEGKIDLDALRETLGDYADERQERYSFTWNGKARARRIAQTPSTGTLRPCPEESVNWDTTQNLFIEGDNLEVLKLLQKSYHKKVKMIYIDPPYNTGRDFIYPDDFSDSIVNYKTLTGQLDEAGRRVSTNSETSGRFHTNWLNMMYPRLKLARNVLSDTGIICISIDDTEVANVRKLRDEIFGEENFIAQLIWKKRSTPPNDKTVGAQHDYIIIYCKLMSEVSLTLRERSKQQIERYKNPDNHPKGPWAASDLTANVKGGRFVESLHFSITNPNSGEEHYPSAHGNWRFNKDRVDRLLANDEIYFGADGKGKPMLKRFLCDIKEGITWTSIWDFVPYNTEGSQQMRSLLGGSTIFENPKPSGLIEHLLKLGMGEDGIVLDFFAGSCSTAQAALDLNAEDSGARQFVMVQLPEECDQESDPYKAGYKTIADIGKERIRRAGKKVVSDQWEVISKEEKASYGCKELSRADCVAKGDGFSQADLFVGQEVTERGTVQPVGSDAAGGGFNSIEHSGRTGTQLDQGVSSVSGDSQGLEGGTGNTASSLRESGIPCRYGYFGSDAALTGDREDGVCSFKNTVHCSLTTKHCPDLGFKVFKLDASNIKPWDADFDNLEGALFDAVENIKPDRSEADVLYELLLKYGLDLAVPIEKREFRRQELGEKQEQGSQSADAGDGAILTPNSSMLNPSSSSSMLNTTPVYIIGAGALIVCLDKDISLEVVEGIATLKQELQPEVMRVVFLDAGFADDVVKTNAVQILRQAEIEDVKSL